MAWASVVYAVATLLLAYPALAGQFLVNPRSDQYIAGYGFREFAAQALRAGEGFPQWDPYLFGGMPYIAAMHGDIFYPTFLLRMIMPTDVAMTWGFIIHVFLAGLFTFGFLRAWGVGFFGALIGGLAYMLSGPIAAYVSPGHDGKLFVSALLPLTLWLLVRGVRDARPWAWGALAVTIGLAVLSPHPQLLQYLLLAGGAFALFLAFGAHEAGGQLSRDVALKRLGLALGAVLIGGLIGAVQYLPVREYVDWSPRAGGKGWDHAISYSMPTEELFNVAVPEFSGILENYWGRNRIHFHSEYAGIVTLILAGAGMFAASVRRNFRWFWIGTLIVSLLWALGGSTPFYRLVYAIVPGTKFFRAPSTMMYVTMFALAVLAAIGAERVVRSAASIPRRFIWAWGGALLALGVAIAAGLPIAVANSVAAAMSAAGWPSDTVAAVIDGATANQGAVVVGVVRMLTFALLALGVVYAAASGRLRGRTVAIAIAALVTADLWSVVTADLLRAASPRDPMFFGSAAMAHRVRNVAGYHGNELGRYQQLLQQGSRYFHGDRPEFWRHENVRYLYTTVPDSLLPQLSSQLGYQGTFTKIVGPVTNASGSPVYLYRVPGDNPPAWVASAIVKGTDEQALATVLDARFDPTRAAIVDPSSSVQAVEPTTVPASAGVEASVTRYAPGEISVQLSAAPPAGAALVVSENFYPGWTARADGRDVPVVRANFNLIGVPLPSGARAIDLRFTDPAYRTGKTITLIALLAAVAWLAAGLVIERRRRRPATA